MKVKNVAVSLLCTFCFCMLDPGYAQSGKPSSEEEKRLDEIGQIMMRATIAGDYETILQYYTDDVIIMPDFAPAIRGKKALAEMYRKDQRDGVKFHSFTGNVEERWQVGNDIFERGTYGIAASSSDSPRPIAYYGSYFQISERLPDGDFKIKFTIWNLDFNPFQ